MQDMYIGIEIGATKQQVAVGDADGGLLYIWRDKIHYEQGASDILAYLSYKVPEAIQKASELGGCVKAVGVGFGGPLESASGRVLISVQVEGWKDFQLKDWFVQRFGLPVKVLNDTVCGGYGELIHGAGRDSRHFFYSNIGSGIGGAFFIDRENYDGFGRGAAYLGHTYVYDWTGESENRIKKTEDICSGFAIERRLRKQGYVPRDSMLMQLCNGQTVALDCRVLAEAASSGDAFALAEIDRVAFSYSIALSNMITLLAPDTVAIGGGVANLGDVLISRIARYSNDLVFITSKHSFRVLRCAHIENAVLIGAIYCASEAYKKTGGYRP